MSYKPSYYRGNWIAICDACGRKFKASILQKRWDGLMVCPDDWEPRQPQDFVRGVPEYISPPFTRPEALPDTFEVIPGACGNASGISGWAISGCAIPSDTDTGYGIYYVDPIPPGTPFY